jgi:hypothetical protein
MPRPGCAWLRPITQGMLQPSTKASREPGDGEDGATTGRQQSGWSFALTLGLGIALVDASPGWDDTGVSAVTLFAACFLLGVVSPQQPWLWAEAVGGWILAFGIVLRHDAPNVGSLLALVVAVAGAYAGAGVRALMAGARSGGKYVAPCGCPAPFHYGANLLSA